MPRRVRYIPKQGTLVEATCRIIHGRKLLRPSHATNEMIVGILAYAKRMYGVRICAVAYLSNHAHLLLIVDDAKQLAGFMNVVNSKIAREISQRMRWREKIWGGRYRPIVVSDEPEAQIARLRYVLSQGVKEHLVARCVDWPGVHAARHLTTGCSLTGYWFDRSAEYRARLKGETYSTYTFAKPEALTLDPLPCWVDLSKPHYQARVQEIVEDIETEAARDRHRKNIAPLGVKAILRQKTRRRPRAIKRTPAPAFHAVSKAIRRSLIDAYRWFAVAYRNAADQLKTGCGTPEFPKGCFPPSLPFVDLA